MKKVLFIFGTRPEAIKLAPVIFALKNAKDRFNVSVCITAQHREMLDQVLSFFDITPDFDLDVMEPDQDLFTLSSTILLKLKDVLQAVKPDLAFVHGDTTTSMIASLACFYSKVKVGHVEAGLRTFNKYSPFPEEMNRLLTSRLIDFHFAPTEGAKSNLIKEHVLEKNILITGNTVIDALLFTSAKMSAVDNVDKIIPEIKGKDLNGKRIILVTSHRRENHGMAFRNICKALKNIAATSEDVCIVFPVHPNPNIKNAVYGELGNINNIYLTGPLMYQQFVWLMNKSYLILTDSGGIQEEAPSLKKPVFVMRETTERPEALQHGFIKVVGTDPDLIASETILLLNDEAAYTSMKASFNPYGDGKASERIVDFLQENLK